MDKENKTANARRATMAARPSLKPPGSAGRSGANRRRLSVKFADTADIRLIYQLAQKSSGSPASSSSMSASFSPASAVGRQHRGRHVEVHEDCWVEMPQSDTSSDSSGRASDAADMSCCTIGGSAFAELEEEARRRQSAPVTQTPTLAQVNGFYGDSEDEGDGAEEDGDVFEGVDDDVEEEEEEEEGHGDTMDFTEALQQPRRPHHPTPARTSVARLAQSPMELTAVQPVAPVTAIARMQACDSDDMSMDITRCYAGLAQQQQQDDGDDGGFVASAEASRSSSMSFTECLGARRQSTASAMSIEDAADRTVPPNAAPVPLITPATAATVVMAKGPSPSPSPFLIDEQSDMDYIAEPTVLNSAAWIRAESERLSRVSVAPTPTAKAARASTASSAESPRPFAALDLVSVHRSSVQPAQQQPADDTCAAVVFRDETAVVATGDDMDEEPIVEEEEQQPQHRHHREDDTCAAVVFHEDPTVVVEAKAKAEPEPLQPHRAAEEPAEASVQVEEEEEEEEEEPRPQHHRHCEDDTCAAVVFREDPATPEEETTVPPEPECARLPLTTEAPQPKHQHHHEDDTCAAVVFREDSDEMEEEPIVENEPQPQHRHHREDDTCAAVVFHEDPATPAEETPEADYANVPLTTEAPQPKRQHHHEDDTCAAVVFHEDPATPAVDGTEEESIAEEEAAEPQPVPTVGDVLSKLGQPLPSVGTPGGASQLLKALFPGFAPRTPNTRSPGPPSAREQKLRSESTAAMTAVVTRACEGLEHDISELHARAVAELAEPASVGDVAAAKSAFAAAASAGLVVAENELGTRWLEPMAERAVAVARARVAEMRERLATVRKELETARKARAEVDAETVRLQAAIADAEQQPASKRQRRDTNPQRPAPLVCSMGVQTRPQPCTRSSAAEREQHAALALLQQLARDETAGCVRISTSAPDAVVAEFSPLGIVLAVCPTSHAMRVRPAAYGALVVPGSVRETVARIRSACQAADDIRRAAAAFPVRAIPPLAESAEEPAAVDVVLATPDLTRRVTAELARRRHRGGWQLRAARTWYGAVLDANSPAAAAALEAQTTLLGACKALSEGLAASAF